MTEVLLGIDVGEKRIGLALARSDVRLSHPYMTVTHDETAMETLQAIITKEHVDRLIVGLPRGMQGQSTAQTAVAEAFAVRLAKVSGLPFVMQDEALTSVRAEQELQSRGKPFAKGDVDALAATYIVQDYLESSHV